MRIGKRGGDGLPGERLFVTVLFVCIKCLRVCVCRSRKVYSCYRNFLGGGEFGVIHLRKKSS